MSYTRQSLAPGEHVLYSGGISMLWLLWRTAVSFVWFVLWLVVFFPVTLLVVALWISHVVRWWTTEYSVTDRRILFKTGLISRDTTELVRSRIESTEVIQSIIGRVFGFGTVVFRGQGTNHLAFVCVQAPLYVKTKIS
jgi:uncharacterized membrane protein YdbT with pleckstrin-like domain